MCIFPKGRSGKEEDICDEFRNKMEGPLQCYVKSRSFVCQRRYVRTLAYSKKLLLFCLLLTEFVQKNNSTESFSGLCLSLTIFKTFFKSCNVSKKLFLFCLLLIDFVQENNSTESFSGLVACVFPWPFSRHFSSLAM